MYQNFNLILTFFICLNAHLAFGLEVQTIRVVKSYANYIFLQCPLTSDTTVDQLKWVNGFEDYITDSNLVSSSQSSLQLSDSWTCISCGYVLANKYIRIKTWTIIFIGNKKTNG